MRLDDGSLAGYVHVKDVLGTGPTSRDQPVPDRAVKDFVALSPAEPLPEVLQEMRRSGSHLGWCATATRWSDWWPWRTCSSGSSATSAAPT